MEDQVSGSASVAPGFVGRDAGKVGGSPVVGLPVADKDSSPIVEPNAIPGRSRTGELASRYRQPAVVLLQPFPGAPEVPPVPLGPEP